MLLLACSRAENPTPHLQQLLCMATSFGLMPPRVSMPLTLLTESFNIVSPLGLGITRNRCLIKFAILITVILVNRLT